MSLAALPDAVATPNSVMGPRRHERSNTLESTSSTSTVYAKRAYNGYAADGRVPTSPTSSTISGGSPRSFYSFAQASTSQASTIKDGEYVSLGDEDDLGDRTITHQGDAPRQAETNGKGKQRAREQDDRTKCDIVSEVDYAQEPQEESAKVEQTLRRWAEKEKLRRAKTRSKNIAPGPGPPPLVSEGIAAVSGLARRMSGARVKPNGHRTKGSRILESMDSGKAPLDEGEELELQPQLPYKSASPPEGQADSLASPPPALTFGLDERIERVTKTGSRFIEDLEDQDMQPFGEQSRPQSYANLNSNTNTPLQSPTKAGGKTPCNKLRLKLADGRANSFSSIISFGSNKEGPFSNHHAVTSRSSMASLKSPTDSTLPTQYYANQSESTSNLVLSPRDSRDFRDLQDGYRDDEDYSAREMGWLEWFFCCACFRSGVQLDEDDIQAGRTFPG